MISIRQAGVFEFFFSQDNRLKCDLEKVMKKYIINFNQGFWYEHAKQDVTQPRSPICGCPAIDWRFLPEEASATEPGLDVLDVGLLHCPKIAGIDGEDYFSNMTIEVFDKYPGYFIESW